MGIQYEARQSAVYDPPKLSQCKGWLLRSEVGRVNVGRVDDFAVVAKLLAKAGRCLGGFSLNHTHWLRRSFCYQAFTRFELQSGHFQ